MSTPFPNINTFPRRFGSTQKPLLTQEPDTYFAGKKTIAAAALTFALAGPSAAATSASASTAPMTASTSTASALSGNDCLVTTERETTIKPLGTQKNKKGDIVPKAWVAENNGALFLGQLDLQGIFPGLLNRGHVNKGTICVGRQKLAEVKENGEIFLTIGNLKARAGVVTKKNGMALVKADRGMEDLFNQPLTSFPASSYGFHKTAALATLASLKLPSDPKL